MEITKQILIENGWKQSDKKLSGYDCYEMSIPTDMDELFYNLRLVDLRDNTFMLNRSNSQVIGKDNIPITVTVFNGTLYSIDELETVLDWTFYRDNKRVVKHNNFV